jgi:hypothetical protein
MTKAEIKYVLLRLHTPEYESISAQCFIERDEQNSEWKLTAIQTTLHFFSFISISEDPIFRIPLSQEEPLYTFYVFSPIAKIILNENVHLV